MESIRIKWGQTYGILQTWALDGVEVALTPANLVACRVTRKLGGDVFLDVPATVVDGKLSVVFDTGEPPWVPGTYYIDTRMTTLDGLDFWSDPERLDLDDRNTPSS